MRKIYILYIATISIISLIYINNTSALNYSSNVGIGFTFNPTLSVSISPSDLMIDNLIPGSTLDSNSINISVATNASYGYTLSATVGDSTHNNSNLTHSNNTNVFSSIAINSNLPSLTTDNTWGYNTSLDSGSTWSNYNGLSNSSNTALLDKDSNISSSIDFRIGAKASPVQPSGTYTNTITFTAVTKPAPITLSEAYASEGKTMINGYYTMQDMTSTICEKTEAIGAQLQVLDIRDNKLYWISKLADNHCWMTQNLDLDIVSGSTNLTSNNTDLSTNENIYTDANTVYALKGASDIYGYTYENNVATWIPERTTIIYNQLSTSTWQNSFTEPYSYDRLDNNGHLVYPDASVSQLSAEAHGLSGNYYNWSAAIASNDSTNANTSSFTVFNSICPKSWRLPINDYDILNKKYNNNSSTDHSGLISAPLYFIRAGYVDNGSLRNTGAEAVYWSSKVRGGAVAGRLLFNDAEVNLGYFTYKNSGSSIRCLAR